MMDDFNNSSIGSRYNKQNKRRKTNFILNILIAIVVVLILLVSFIIFGSDKKDKDGENNSLIGQHDNEENNNSNLDNDEDVDSSTDEGNDNNSNGGNQGDDQISNDELPPPTYEEGTGENIKKTIINPAWEPVGTEQTGTHETVFDQESVDWKEMEQALAYATGIPHENLRVWFLGNGGHNKAIGTVSAKNDHETFRVYIEWIDNRGWRPTKVEQLIENDKASVQ